MEYSDEDVIMQFKTIDLKNPKNLFEEMASELYEKIHNVLSECVEESEKKNLSVPEIAEIFRSVFLLIIENIISSNLDVYCCRKNKNDFKQKSLEYINDSLEMFKLNLKNITEGLLDD